MSGPWRQSTTVLIGQKQVMASDAHHETVKDRQEALKRQGEPKNETPPYQHMQCK